MNGLPVVLNVSGRRVLVAGGGRVAARRVKDLVEAGADVVVVAPSVEPEIEAAGVKVHRRGYETDDLSGTWLVIVATDDGVVNQRIGDDAARRGVLVNRADDSRKGDVTVPAHRRVGPIALTVSTGGTSGTAGAALADLMVEAIGEDWPVLLEVIGPLRVEAQQKVRDTAARQRLYKRWVDDEAMSVLQSGGREALTAHCRALMDATEE